MAAAAVTLVKKASTTLGSQLAPSSNTDLIFEVVHVTLAETADWVECGGASPQTQFVRRPIAAFITAADAVGAALVGEAQGINVTISGTKVVFTGGSGTEASATFWVLIVGLPV